MSRRVLVPLDRTNHAEKALEALSGLCDPGDKIVLLAVGEPAHQTERGVRPGRILRGDVRSPGGVVGAFGPDYPVYAETRDQVIQGQIDDLQNYLHSHVAKLESQGFEVERIVEISNEPAEAIVDVARRLRPAFIVMVRTTHPTIASRLFGTVAQHVIRENAAPVLILPSAA